MRSIELFGGAGGLAMGVAAAGFTHDAVIEWDRHACVTLRENKIRGVRPIKSWPLYEADVRTFDYSAIPPGVDLLAGGPPCQPFSIGGKHSGFHDNRNMFPEAVRAVRELRPRAFVFENVRGLVRESFAEYFDYIKFQLTYPKVARKAEEDWQTHLMRLQQHHTSSPHRGLRYNVVSGVLNASNFGVPQKRDRVFIVGFRYDLDVQWSFPAATHSHDALLWKKWVTGEYWAFHRIAKKHRQSLTPQISKRVERLRLLGEPNLKPWKTVRDAIGDLPTPTSRQPCLLLNHTYQPGARRYAGHTGSPLDDPAKTLKAGDHGVPGGENMLALPSGEVRYFTVRESARLQTFPDDMYFPESWTETMRQLGNAVPVELAEVLVRSVAQHLDLTQQSV
jgi:DNA (cytosine-5)-methyltransferase 1